MSTKRTSGSSVRSQEAGKPERAAMVYCAICTHTVSGMAEWRARKFRVKPGQRCPRCSSLLDAGMVVSLLDQAA